MSFEQQEINRREEDKNRQEKEKEKTDLFLLEKKILRESAELIQKLAREISKEFGISIMQAQEIISGKTNNSLENLKQNIGQNNEHINITRFSDAITRAKESIEDISKKYRETLKSSIQEDSFNPETNNHYLTKNIIPENIRERIKNAGNIQDQILGVGLGIIDSSEAIILFTYALGKGIILTPYHIYLVIIGKAEFPYKNI